MIDLDAGLTLTLTVISGRSKRRPACRKCPAISLSVAKVGTQFLIVITDNIFVFSHGGFYLRTDEVLASRGIETTRATNTANAEHVQAIARCW